MWSLAALNEPGLSLEIRHRPNPLQPTMRSFALVTILICGAAWNADAQSSCSSLNFRNAPSASLTPSANTLLYLQRQGDGSYASYETSINPYQVLSITPHFERQLTTCLTTPAPVAPANPARAASQLQAVALLDLSSPSDQVFLCLFGTGFDTATPTPRPQLFPDSPRR